MVTPPSFPARPVSGGPLLATTIKTDDDAAEPKWNGWRATVHRPSGLMFNRHGETLSIAKEFTVALEKLRNTPVLTFDWFDVECLERRHNIGRGTLIVLDVMPDTHRAFSYQMRRGWLECSLPITPPPEQPLEDNALYLTASFPGSQSRELYARLAEANRALGTELFEGIVTKRRASAYPLQLLRHDREFALWMKHRWRW